MGFKIGKKVRFNWFQLVVFCTGMVLVLSLVGYLTYQAVSLDGKPPKVEVHTTYMPELPDYTFRLKVTNRGEKTATNANIKLTLYQEGKATEAGTLSFSYLPIQSEQTAWIVFDKKRQKGDSLVLSSITYLEP